MSKAMLAIVSLLTDTWKVEQSYSFPEVLMIQSFPEHHPWEETPVRNYSYTVNSQALTRRSALLPTSPLKYLPLIDNTPLLGSNP